MVSSLNEINTLIDKYGKDWQKHLDELDLKTEVDIQEKKNWWTTFRTRVQSVLDANANAFKMVVDVVSKVTSGNTASGNTNTGSSTNSSSNSSTLASSFSSNTLAPTSSSLTDRLGQATSSYSTARDLLVAMSLGNVYGSPLVGFNVKTNKGKENSYYIETWNLSSREVDYLKENGFTIRKDNGKTKRGIRQVRQFANGGIGIQSGDLFVANENAPELVGRIGNKTAVANQTQIITGIENGVAKAISPIERRLARIEEYAGITAEKEPTVKITPSVALGRVNAQAAAMYGRVTGRG
jgi:hypothetical protein